MTDSHKGLRILIVEDNPGDHNLISGLLAASVIKIQLLAIAETLEKAMDHLQKESFDIILLDLSLPDCSGIDTFKTIKEHTGKTPVIILSAPADMKIAAEAISLGAQDYHIKSEPDEKMLTKTILYSIERMHKPENLREGNERYITISKAELDLMKSEEITRRIIGSALDAIICIDIYDNIIVWNPQAEKIFGWKQFEILGKKLTETIIPAAYREMHEKGVSHYLATGEGPILNKLIELTAVNRAGKQFPVELSIVPLTEGGNLFFCAFIRDITERKKAELSIKESEVKFRAFFENSMDGILLTSLDGRVFSANPAACEIFGRTEEEICMAGRENLIDTSDIRLTSLLEDRRKKGKAKGELTCLRKDGTRVPIELTSAIFTDELGEERTCMIVRDISERKRNEEALKASEQNLRQVLSSSAENFYVIDRSCCITLINESAGRNLSKAWCKPVTVGINIFDAIPAGKEKLIKASLDQVFEGKMIDYELHQSVEDLPEWVHISYMPVCDDDGAVLGAYIVTQDISERKKAEEILRKSEEQYRDLVDNITDLICTHDLSGRILSANRAAEKLIGHKFNPEENLNIKDILAEDRKNDFNQYIQEIQKKGHVEGLMKVRTFSGEVRIWEYSNSLKTTGVEIPVVRGYARDITEMKKAETGLKQSNERFEMISRTTNDAVWEWDFETGKMWGNETHQQLYGLTTADPVPDEKQWQQRLHPDDREPMMKKQAEALASDTNVFITEYRFNTEKEGYKNIYDRCYIVRNAEGKAVRILGSMMDITERKKAEDLIRESEERYKALVENAPEALVVFDVESRKFVSVSESAEKLFKMTREELLKIGPVELSPAYQPDGKLSAESAAEKISEAINGGKPSFEWTHCDKEGNLIPCEIWLVRLPSETRTLIRGSIIDITIRKKAELKLKESEEKYRSVIEQATDFVMITDLQGNFIDANSGFCKTFGYSKEELLQLNIDKVIDPGQLKIKPLRFDLLIKGETVLNERRMLTREGAIIDVEANVKMLPDGRVMAIARDISDRKKTEAKLKEQEEQLRLFVEHSPASLAMLDNDMRYIIVSKRWMTDYNIADQKIIGKSHYEVFPGIPQRWKEIHQRCLAGAIEKSEYDSFTRTDGSVDWVRWEVHPWYKASGEVGGIIMFTEVITERIKAEKELTNERNLLRALIDHLPDYIYVKDTSFNYIISNRAFVKLVGAASEAENIHKNSIDLFGKEIGGVNMEEDKKIFATGETVIDRDEPIVTKDGGKLWLLTTKVPLRDQENKVTGILGISKDITERKEAERIIRESEEKYRTMIEQAPDGVFISDKNAFLVDVNSSGCIMTGYSKEELLKMRYLDLISPEDLRKTPIRFNDLYSGKIVLSERKVIRKDGTEILVEINAKLRYDGMIQSFIRDVTDRKKTEQAIKESEEKYRTLVEQAADAIALYDASGKILDVNTGSVNLLGYAKEELMKMYLSDVLTKEEIQAKPVQYDVLQKGESTVKQRMMRKKDGSVVQTEVRSQQLPDGRFLSVIRDLSDRIKAQDLILKEKELSNEIIDSIPGVFFLRTKDRFLRWNKQFEKITGYTAEEIARIEPVTPFYDDSDKESVNESLNKLFTDGSAVLEAAPRTKEGGKTPFYFNARIITYEGQQCMICTGIDISDRKKAEQELEESYKAIRKLTEHLQNIREEERAHMAREIHDELGQQLTVLKMDISWINKKMGIQDEPVKARMKELLVMLDETVKSVRRISSELRPSLLDDLGLIAAMEWQLTEFEKRFEIKTHFKPDDTEITLPESIKTGLFRIFQESLTNVARHAKAKKVTVSLKMENGSIVLSVADNGLGFDKQNSIGKKTLGILGMQERTSMMGGTYEISGKPGKGTKIVVTIPLDDRNKN